MKKISYLILTLFFQTMPQTIHSPQLDNKSLAQLIAEKKAAHNIEFAFDIHSVLIHKDIGSQWKVFWHYPAKSKLFKSLFNISLLSDLGSMVWQSFLNVLPWQTKYKDVTSNQLISAFENVGEYELAELFTTMVNTQIIDPKMKQLIIELKNARYSLRIASNIGKLTFIKLKKKLESEQNNIFKYFEKDKNGMEGKAVDYTVSTAQKPDSEYYIQYLDAYDPAREKLIIFVDDKWVNIIPAIAQGMLGIHFKNAQQLRNDLRKLEIL